MEKRHAMHRYIPLQRFRESFAVAYENVEAKSEKRTKSKIGFCFGNFQFLTLACDSLKCSVLVRVINSTLLAAYTLHS